VSAPRPCVLGCRNRDGIPFRAAPGSNVCHPCSDRLRRTLDHIETTYAAVTALDELIPGGHSHGTGVRTPPGPRSPTVDSILIHTDPRYPRDGWHDQPAALAEIAGWVRLVREDRSVDVPPAEMRATVPVGRVTMARELSTLRFHWDWLMAQGWVPDFADAMNAVLRALRTVDAQQAKATRVGKCPVVVIPREATGLPIDLECGAWLRLKIGEDEIRCRNCGHTWPRGRWSEIGEPWTTYGELARIWDMPGSTLRGWAKEHTWRTVTLSRKKVIVLRADAVATYMNRRGMPLGEAG